MSHHDVPAGSTLTLRSPGDLLSELPGLLGYHPADSLVAVFTQDRTVKCVLRMDLTAIDSEAAIRIVSIAHRAEADTLYVVVYSPSVTEELPHRPAIETLDGLLGEAGIQLADALLVADGRYRSYLCSDVTCCPPEGRPVPDTTRVLEAERVRTGRLAVASSRSEAAAAYRLRPDLEPSADALRTAELLLSRSPEERGRLAVAATESLARLIDDGQLGLAWVDDQLDEGFRAVLVLLLQDVHVRDYLLGALAASPGSVHGPVEALVRTAVSAPTQMRPRLAGTAAALLAVQGDDPVALWSMVDLAEDDSLAALVRAGAEQGVPPQEIRAVFAEALPQVRERMTVS